MLFRMLNNKTVVQRLFAESPLGAKKKNTLKQSEIPLDVAESEVILSKSDLFLYRTETERLHSITILDPTSQISAILEEARQKTITVPSRYLDRLRRFKTSVYEFFKVQIEAKLKRRARNAVRAAKLKAKRRLTRKNKNKLTKSEIRLYSKAKDLWVLKNKEILLRMLDDKTVVQRLFADSQLRAKKINSGIPLGVAESEVIFSSKDLFLYKTEIERLRSITRLDPISQISAILQEERQRTIKVPGLYFERIRRFKRSVYEFFKVEIDGKRKRFVRHAARAAKLIAENERKEKLIKKLKE